MADSVADLLVKLDIESTKFRAEIDKANEKLEDLGSKIDKLVGKVSAGIAMEAAKHVATFIGKLEDGVKAMAEFALSGGAAAEKMEHLAQVTGMTSDKIAELAFIAKGTGVEGDAMAGAFAKLERQMAAAAGGNHEVTQAFKAMHVQFQSSPGVMRPVGEVAEEIAKKIASYSDGAAKTALVQQLMGKGAADQIPLLNRLGREGFAALRAEAEAYGATLDTRTIRQSAEFKEQTAKVQGGVDALAVKLSSQLNPVMYVLSERFKDAAEKGGLFEKTLKLTDDAAKTFAIGLAYASEKLELWGKTNQLVADVASSIVHGRLGEAKNYWAQYSQDVAAMNFKLAMDIGKIWAPGLFDLQIPGKDQKKDAPVVVNDAKEVEAVKHVQAAIDQLKVHIAGLKASGDLNFTIDESKFNKESLGADVFRSLMEKMREADKEYAQLQERLRHGDIEKALEKAVSKAFDLRNAFNLLVFESDRLARQKAIFEVAQQAAKGLDDEVQRLSASSINLSHATELEAVQWDIAHGKLRQYLNAIALTGQSVDGLKAKFETLAAQHDMEHRALGIISNDMESYRALSDEAIQVLSGLQTPTEIYLNSVDRLDRMLRAGMLTQEQYSAAITKLGSDFTGFGEVGKQVLSSFEDGIAELVVNGGKGFSEIASRFGKMIETMLIKAVLAKTIGLLLDTVFAAGGGGGAGAAAAGAVSSKVIEAHASGGFATAGRAILVGEKGPEIFMPDTSGTVIPNHELSAFAQSGGDLGRGGFTLNANLSFPSTIPHNYTDVQRHMHQAVLPVLKQLTQSGQLEFMRRAFLRD